MTSNSQNNCIWKLKSEKSEIGAEEIHVEIMAKKFFKVTKDTKPQVQASQRIPNRMNTHAYAHTHRYTQRHTHSQETKVKEKILNSRTTYIKKWSSTMAYFIYLLICLFVCY